MKKKWGKEWEDLKKKKLHGGGKVGCKQKETSL